MKIVMVVFCLVIGIWFIKGGIDILKHPEHDALPGNSWILIPSGLALVGLAIFMFFKFVI